MTLLDMFPCLKDEEFLSVVTILHSVWKKDEWEEANQIILHKNKGTKQIKKVETFAKKSSWYKVPKAG